ncbi:MAG: helix-turn-helix domain-containing protein [Clostridia bacterium]|nr:helix-turn-helix domain-containing protein [Clostridia bacterium]
MNELLRTFGPYKSQLPFNISLAGITYPDPSYHISRAASEVAVIEYVVDGEGYVTVGDKVHRVQANTVYLLSLGARHLYYSDAKNPFTKIFMNISGPLGEQLIREYGLDGKHFFSGEGLGGCFERILTAVRSDRTDGEVQSELQGIFLEILSRLSLSLAETVYSDELVRLKSHLDANLGRIVSTAELARVIFRSPDYCLKLFRRELGITPYAYQLERKLQTACSLLADTQLSVGEIAQKLGYSDIHYFSNLFKRKCGASPLGYRKGKR